MVIETERLLLKSPQPEFAEACAAYYKRNKAFLALYEPKRESSFYEPAHHLGILADEMKQMHNQTMAPFYLFRKEEPETVVGKINLSNIVWGAFRSCFLGYKLDESYINQGYMTEAVKAVVRYAFEDLGLHRIEGNVMLCNARSMRVLENCGFQSEGIAEKYLKIHGAWEDHVHMVIRNHAME